MKILYITQSYLPSVSSSSLSIVKMCRAFAGDGHRVTLAAPRSVREVPDIHAFYDLDNDVDVQTFYYSRIHRYLGLRNWAFAARLQWVMDRLAPNVVYARFCLEALNNLRTDAQVFYEMHSPGPLTGSYLDKRLFEKNIRTGKINRIVATTNMLESYLKDLYPDLQVVVARLSSENPVAVESSELLRFKERNLRGRSAFAVGYTGFLDKNGLRGTEVICKIAAAMPDVDFHIVGGPDEVSEYWERKARSGNIYFYGRRKPNEMPFFLKSFDAVLAPLQLVKNRRHPLGMGLSPLKIPQYLSYGCAIVASDIPAHREVLSHGVNCLLCEPGNIDEWRKAIRRLQSESELGKIMGEAAERLYYSEFTPSNRIKKILSLS